MAGGSLCAAWNDHPHREQALQEAHARPPMPVTGDALVVHFAFIGETDSLCKSLGIDLSGSNRHAVTKINTMPLKVEKHTEFFSLTFFAKPQARREEIVALARDLLSDPGSQTVVLLELFLFETIETGLKRLSFGDRIYGGQIEDGIEVRSTLRSDEDGFVTYVLGAPDLSSESAGYAVQRILDVETYRIMCMLGLPMARDVANKVSELEHRLDSAVSVLSQARSRSAAIAVDDALFQKYAALSAEAGKLAADARYRFGASRAYYDLVRQRLAELKEARSADHITISSFLYSRIDPAMATIANAGARLEALRTDIDRSMSLLRTLIDLRLNNGNQELLKSLNDRQEQQVRISQTVEGLSIVAITYYAVGLVSYGVKAAVPAEAPISPAAATAALIPAVLLAVWYALRRIRKRWTGSGQI